MFHPSKFEIQNKKFEKGDRFQLNAALTLYKKSGHFNKHIDGSLEFFEQEIEVFPQLAVEFKQHPIPEQQLDNALEELMRVIKVQAEKAGIVQSK